MENVGMGWVGDWEGDGWRADGGAVVMVYLLFGSMGCSDWILTSLIEGLQKITSLLVEVAGSTIPN